MNIDGNKSAENLPQMTELMKLEKKLRGEGYTSNFRVVEEGLTSDSSSSIYTPEEVNVINFFRFEGISDPEDNSILYVIETSKNEKGLLSDAYGMYSTPEVDEFFKQVDKIQKKTHKHNEGTEEKQS